LSGGNDFEIFFHSAVTVNASLKSNKDIVSLNKFAEDSLVTIKGMHCCSFGEAFDGCSLKG